MLQTTEQAYGLRKSGAALEELDAWTEAVGERLDTRMSEITAMRDTTRFLRADCSVLGLAMQDVQLHLTDPDDMSGLQQKMPHMAERAQSHEHAAAFVAAARTHRGKPRLLAGALATAAVLMPDINIALYISRGDVSEQQEKLEDAATFKRPNLIARRRARQTGIFALMSTTVLG